MREEIINILKDMGIAYNEYKKGMISYADYVQQTELYADKITEMFNEV